MNRFTLTYNTHGHECIRINMHFTYAISPHHIQVIHLCIDRNIQPNVTAGICNYNVNNLKLDYICTSLHFPLSFRIDVRLEDRFYSYGYRLVTT